MPGNTSSNAASTSSPRRTSSKRLGSVTAISPAARAHHAPAQNDAFGPRESRIPERRGLTFWGQWLVAVSLQLLLLSVLALL